MIEKPGKTMDIREVTDAGGKRRITRMILEALPDWFEANPCRVYVMALK